MISLRREYNIGTNTEKQDFYICPLVDITIEIFLELLHTATIELNAGFYFVPVNEDGEGGISYVMLKPLQSLGATKKVLFSHRLPLNLQWKQQFKSTFDMFFDKEGPKHSILFRRGINFSVQFLANSGAVPFSRLEILKWDSVFTSYGIQLNNMQTKNGIFILDAPINNNLKRENNPPSFARFVGQEEPNNNLKRENNPPSVARFVGQEEPSVARLEPENSEEFTTFINDFCALQQRAKRFQITLKLN